MLWPTAVFADVVEARGSGAAGLAQGEWQDAGAFPVIGQGAGAIEGWSDRHELVIKPEPALVLYGGHTRRAKYVDFPFIAGPNVKILRPSKALDPKFLYYFLKQLPVASRGYADHFPEVRRVPVPLPPLSEQRRISSILDRAEGIRDRRSRVWSLLVELRGAMFTQLFGAEHELAQRWPISRLDAIATDMKIGLVRGSDQIGDSYSTPYVRMDAVSKDGEFLPERVLRTDASESELDEFGLKAGDLLFNTRNSRELVGKTALFRGGDGAIYNNNLMRLRFRDDIDPEFIAAAFLSSFVQKQLEACKAGTTSVFAIYARDLKTLRIPTPPIEVQCVFGSRMNLIERLKLQYRSAMAESDALLQTLRRRAFRGEL